MVIVEGRKKHVAKKTLDVSEKSVESKKMILINFVPS
jgi:hypothetical protein